MITCKICNNEISTQTNEILKEFCSTKCREKYYERKHIKEREKMKREMKNKHHEKCKVCNRRIYNINFSVKYCSGECKKMKDEKDKEKKIRQRTRQLFINYNMTPEDFDNMLKLQNNKCAICDDELNGRKFVDHNHATHKVREILCYNCNVLLGFAREKEFILLKAIAYLQKHN